MYEQPLRLLVAAVHAQSKSLAHDLPLTIFQALNYYFVGLELWSLVCCMHLYIKNVQQQKLEFQPTSEPYLTEIDQLKDMYLAGDRTKLKFDNLKLSQR